MTTQRWDPLQELQELRDKVEQLFENNLDAVGMPESFSAAWIPSTDIAETDNQIIVQSEIPGLQLSAIDIHIDGTKLKIKGERNATVQELADIKHHRIERLSGKFARTIELPKSTNIETVQAYYQDGILKITFQKIPHEPRERVIPVKVNQ